MNNDLSHTQIIRPLQDSSLAVTEVIRKRVQSDQSDCGVCYVRRSYLHYEL